MSKVDKSLLKHPSSLWWLALVYALFMWAFGSQVAGVTLYMINNFSISQDKAYGIFAAYSALLWTMPLIGGYLSSKFGMRLSAMLGLMVCTVGSALLIMDTYQMTILGLAIFLVGNAFFTPSSWCLVDHAYKKDDLRRESGFTLYYLLFNMGAVLGIFGSGYLQDAFSYQTSFEVSASLLLVAVIIFALTAPKLTLEPSRPVGAQLNWPAPLIVLGLLVCLVIGCPIVMVLMHHLSITNGIMTAMAVFAALSLVYIAWRQPKGLSRMRVIGFLILVLFSNVFWALYSLEPSLVSVFIDHSTSHQVFGMPISSSSMFGFEGVFVIIVGLLLSRLWTTLARREIKVQLSYKFALAMILIGLGYLYLRMLLTFNGFEQVLALGWVIICYLFFATGELFIGPLGISMVGKLSPKGQEGYFMGVLQLYMGFASIITGVIAKYTVVDKGASFAVVNQSFASTFVMVAFGSILVGVILLILGPFLKRVL